MTVLERLESAGHNGEAREIAAFLAGFLPLGRPVILTEAIVEAAREHDAVALASLLAEEVQPEPDEIEALREANELDDGSRHSLDEVRRELGLDS